MTKDIESLVEKHENLRKEGINLIASENFISKKVRNILSSDLAGRYHADFYGGSKYAQEIVEKTKELAEELFDVKHAFVKPVSGNLCDLNVLFSLTEPYDKVAMMDFENGGYPFGLEKFDRKRVSLPTHEDSFEIDVEKAQKIIDKENPRLTILGSSYIPFPHPVKQISESTEDCIEEHHLVFDGSHVLGLIATDTFQNPLSEGADVLIGSTHKSLYGPQGGLILTDSDHHAELISDYLDIDLETGIGLVDNPHVNRIAALGAALKEMLDDEEYGKRIVENAKELGKSLDDLGVPVKFKGKGYTESHQIFLDIEDEDSQKLCKKLEKENIFIDIGGRIGVAEVTHRGMNTDEMEKIAQKIAEKY
ncbi:MAG: serine hydroxymethyltransferase [Thermoplasmata archaeon]